MKRLFRKYRKALCSLVGIFTVVVLAAAIFRALSIARNEGSEGMQIDSQSWLRYIWLELSSLFKFSRY